MQRVAQRQRLAQKMIRCGLLARRIPYAPLVNDELGTMLEFTHRLPVPRQDLFRPQTLAQDRIPAGTVEARDLLLRLPEIGVVMDRESVQRCAMPLHRFVEASRPADIQILRMPSRTGRCEKRLRR